MSGLRVAGGVAKKNAKKAAKGFSGLHVCYGRAAPRRAIAY